jgi:hypothetical protein
MSHTDCKARWRRRGRADEACFGVAAPWAELASSLVRRGYLAPLDAPHGFGRRLTAAERVQLTRALNEFVWRELCGFET